MVDGKWSVTRLLVCVCVCVCVCSLVWVLAEEWATGHTAEPVLVIAPERPTEKPEASIYPWLPTFFFLTSLLLAALGLPCCTWAFSGFTKRGLLSSCGAQASHCSGLPCCGAQALGVRASVAVAHGLSCSLVCGISPGLGIEPMSLALAGGFLATGPWKSPTYLSHHHTPEYCSLWAPVTSRLVTS